jgi:predicted  nucleic acid-binding Zn-ribbon protein
MTWAKILQFGLKNWREIVVIACLSLVAIKTQLDYRALNKAYEISRQEMELQIDSLREIHAEEIRQREEAIESYRSAIEEIEQNYLASVAELEEQREKSRTEHIRQFSQDREALSDEIINAYGFELVE